MAKQYHYVVMYDDTTKKWHVEDETLYLDGNVYDTESEMGEGWDWPFDGTHEARMDVNARFALKQMLDNHGGEVV